jgi:hypothetical protein
VSTTKTCSRPDCDGEHRARGLCNRHYLASRRRWDRAGRPEDWDWTAGASKQRASKSSNVTKGQRTAAGQNFTGVAGRGPGGDPPPPPPAASRRKRKPAAKPEPPPPPGLIEAVDAALAQLPEADQRSARAALVRILARSVVDASWTEGVTVPAASVRQLWQMLDELEGSRATDEEDAFDRLARELADGVDATADL